jgi:predicted dithiol-disulfide oxidoreductase (DUF899 family)
MDLPKVVSASEWLAARKELQAAEEKAGRVLAAVSARRRELPATRVEKEYVFEGPAGKVSLLDMFEGRRQLIIHHFMFDPEWDEGCPFCSYLSDSVGHLSHLHARDVTFATVSRAPIGKIEPFRQRMGWAFPWYSSFGSVFNYDFHVTLNEAIVPMEYDYRTPKELISMGQPFFAQPGEKAAVSVFLRDGDSVLHTYTGYGSFTGLSMDLLQGTDNFLDLTPFGRPDMMPRHHDRYPTA